MNRRTKRRMKIGGVALGALVALLSAMTVTNWASSVVSTEARTTGGAGVGKVADDIKANGHVSGDSDASGSFSAPGTLEGAGSSAVSSVDQRAGAPADKDSAPPSDTRRPGKGLGGNPGFGPTVSNFAALASLSEINIACATPDSTSGPSTTSLSIKTVTDVDGIDPGLLGAADLERVTGFVATWSTGSFGFPAQPGAFFGVPDDARFPCPRDGGFRASNRGRGPGKRPTPGEECPDGGEPLILDIAVQALSGDARIGRPATVRVAVNRVCPPS